MGNALGDLFEWLGKNPEILIFLAGLAIGYIVAKR